MVLTRRQVLAENYEDLKQPSPIVNGTTKSPSKIQERRGRKLSFAEVSRLAKFSLSLTFYALECLFTTVVIVFALALLSPILVVYNALKFVERKWVYLRTGEMGMSGQDALWLQDDKKNRLIINSVMILEGNDYKSMLDGVRDILMRCYVKKCEDDKSDYSRLTKCIRPGVFQYFLAEADKFDIAQHVYQYEGESPKSHDEMEDLLSRLCSEDLSFDIPPWRFILVPKVYEENEAILLFRVHHGLADGVSLTRFLMLEFPDQKVVETRLVKFSNADRLLMSVKGLLVGSRILLGKLFCRPDQSIIHGREPAGVKKVSWSEPIDLKLVKRIKNQTGTTVNDVMMACVSMSFHDYFKSQGITNPPDIMASIPVDVRPIERKITFENNFAIVSLSLPVSEKDVLQQLYSTKANMDEVKHSGEAFVMSLGANYTVEYMPQPITNLWNKPIANKHSLVLSNVPGPTTPFTVAGHPVKALFFWPPMRDLVGIGVGIYSYAGKVLIGVHGDVNCLPSPQKIVKGFESKFAELEKSVFSEGQTEADSGIEIQ